MRPLPKFSYNVTRDYPYKWFTPVAIIGGIVLTALFSAINFFSTAYNMVSITTDNPQEIEAGIYGGSYARYFASRFQPKCEDAVLTVGSTFRTNVSLFEYQLTGTGASGAPALVYHNQKIDHCFTSDVILDFSTCLSDTESFLFKLQTRIDPIGIALLGRSGEEDPKPTWWIYSNTAFVPNSFFTWAQALMFMFWEETITAITTQTTTLVDSRSPTPQHNLTHGYVKLYRSSETPGSMQDDQYFYKASWVFFDAARSERYMGSVGVLNDITTNNYVHSTIWPRIWPPVDRLAKAALSAVYLDLGLFPEPHTSMVSDVETLRYWSANLSTIANQSAIPIRIIPIDFDVTMTDYDAQQQLPDNLGALPNLTANNALRASNTLRAIISTTYVCSLPELKPPFNIFVSILVADLVFLRTAWALYNFVVGYFLKRRHTDANVCDECLARKKADDAGIEKREEMAHSDRELEVEEHTIELDYLGPPSPDIHRDDQSSAESLLTHQHV